MAKSFFNTGLLGAAGSSGPSDDQFNRVSFLSHFEGSNNGVNNAFDDGSTSNHTITANGNVTQGSFGPFARPDGEWGVSFDGSGDSVTTPENAATRIAQSNFTFEAFIFPTGGDSNEDTIFTQGADGVYSPFNVFVKSNKITLYISTTGSSWNIANNQSSSNSVAINSWTHVALVRNGATIQLYINGVADNSYNVGTNTFFTPTQVTSVGSRPAGDRPFKGYISNVRLVIGTAIYTSAFTAPTSKLTAVTNTKLLTCQSNRFVDNSATGLAVSITGNPAVTAFGPFLTSKVYDPAVNGASAYFDGDGDYLSVPDSADWDFGSGNYTVEFWIYPRTTGTIQGLVNHWADFNLTNVAWSFEWHSNGNINYYIKTNTASHRQIVAVGGASIANQWMHVAAARNNNVHTLYLDGVSKATVTDAGTMNNCTDILRVGDYWDGNYGFDGEICDVRVVKGTAVYTGNFTPPTAPLTAVTNTKLLLNMADAQAIDSAAQHNLTLYGNAKISTGQAKFGNTSLYLDGSDDYLVVNNHQAYGTGPFTIEMFFRLDSVSGSRCLYDDRPDGASGDYISLIIASGAVNFYVGTTLKVNAGSISANTFYHIALCRSGTDTKLFLDGTQIGSTFSSDTTNYLNTGILRVGTNRGYNNDLAGYIDDFRISHMARYTSNFTAPTEPFADKGQ